MGVERSQGLFRASGFDPELSGLFPLHERMLEIVSFFYALNGKNWE
jgi:hypothetical protein